MMHRRLAIESGTPAPTRPERTQTTILAPDSAATSRTVYVQAGFGLGEALRIGVGLRADSGGEVFLDAIYPFPIRWR